MISVVAVDVLDDPGAAGNDFEHAYYLHYENHLQHENVKSDW
jgi:hypothetical protein